MKRIAEFFSDNEPLFYNKSSQYDLLNSICNKFDIDNITYLGSNLSNNDEDNDALLTTYRGEWEKHYFEQNYQNIDPVIRLGMQSLLPLDWSIIPRKTPIIKKFFGEAMECGISASGLSIPIRGPHGDRALISVNASHRNKDWAKFKNNNISDLTYFSYLLHNAITKIVNPNNTIKKIKLSPQETDVLSWAASGKTAWETGEIMNISERTVSFYIKNAAVKLNAVSKPQAVAKALSLRLITI